MPRVDLTVRLARESKPTERDAIQFDKALTGFGLRVHPSGRKVWTAQARIEGRSRRIVIARHGEMDLAEARRRVRDMLARIRAGGNPADDIQRAKETRTLREFADEYPRRLEPHWKPSGRRSMRIYLGARILPAFGRMPLDRVGPEDAAAWFDAASRDRPGAANCALEILRAMMFRAEEWGLRERDTNPCLGIAKNQRKQVARFLDMDELARLGRARHARGSLARGRRGDPFSGAHRMPPGRCAQSALARYRGGRHRARRLEDRPARGAARRGRAGAHRGAARFPEPGRVPVPAPCRMPGYLNSHELLAVGLRGREARQAAPVRPAPYRREPGSDVGREPSARW